MPADQLVTNYGTEQVFLGDNVMTYGSYTNSSGDTVNLVPGRLMGTILATGALLPNISSATDGSEMPTAFCADYYTVANGATATIAICIGGKINQNAIVLGAGDTLLTAVRTVSTGGGTLRNLILRNISDVELIPSIEVSRVDPNQ